MDGEWRDRFFRFPSRASPFAGGACAASFGRSCEPRRRLSHFHWLEPPLTRRLWQAANRSLIGCQRSNGI